MAIIDTFHSTQSILTISSIGNQVVHILMCLYTCICIWLLYLRNPYMHTILGLNDGNNGNIFNNDKGNIMANNSNIIKIMKNNGTIYIYTFLYPLCRY
jgi:hypothetical protein